MNIQPNFMKTYIGKIIERTRERLRIPIKGERKPLTEEEKRKRARLVVYPLFALLFAGCIWLIYSPSRKEREETVQGFNTDIPSPENRKMRKSKVDAYEEEELMRKEKQRRGTFQEMASLFDRGKRDTVRLPETPAGPVNLPGDTDVPQSAPRSSVDAYRHINRTLDNLYVSGAYDPEKEELKRRIEELERRRSIPEPAAGNTVEEKMALMEKSYELAARYGSGQPGHVRPAGDERERKAARPVRRMQPQAVSSLSRPSGEGELAGERNTGFHTPVGKTLTSERNTIEACVHGTQTVSDGQALRIRLLEPMVVDDRFIPKGTVVTGGTRIQGERLDILVTSLEYKGTLLPVELEVYDSDGLQGIPVPNSMEYDAAREIAANMGGSMNSSINISTDAGAQIASDLGKGVIQGVSQYVTKRMRTVKITLKAGHRLLLHSPGQ